LINKTEDNYVLLEKGEITSCDIDDSHFKLKAEKLWMLSGDEWAISGGVLYIGRVPLLYIPAFLNAGDEIFFNPVLGYKNDFGYFLQTTTYLIGEKEKDDSSFSFLQSDDSSKYSEINGIYLTSDDDPSALKKDFIDSFSDDDYLKIILDNYSNTGIYGAVAGEINQLEILKDISIQASIARTRKIKTTNSGYTYLYLDEDGVYRSIWLSSYFYNIKLPFQYDLDLSFQADFDWIDFKLLLQSYSDNNYTYNFSQRTENLDLLGMLNQTTASSSSSEITSGDWLFKTSISPDLNFLKPWVGNFTISSLQTSIDWRGKKIDTSELSDTTSYDDTVSYFFYPQEYILPSFSASISGQILPLSGEANSVEQDEEKYDIDVELRPPWEDEQNEKIGAAVDLAEFFLPDLLPDLDIEDITVWDENKAFKNKLVYSINPEYSNKTQLKSSDWNIPEDIDLSNIEYSVQSAALKASLTYTAAMFGSFVSVTDILKFSGKYDHHYNMDTLTAADKTKFLNEDKQATEINLTNSFNIIAKPLIGTSFLTGTTLTYNFDNRIYNYDYSTSEDNFLSRLMKLESIDITKHNIALALPLVVGEYKQTLTLTGNLPPLDLSASGKLITEAGISTTELNTSLSESNSIISYEPLTLSEKLGFTTNNYLEGSISYNYEELIFEKTIATGNFSLLENKLTFVSKFIYDFTTNDIAELSADLKFYDFFLNMKGYNTEDYYFNSDDGWQPSGSKSFQFKDFKTGLTIDSEKYVLWKNRINLDFDLVSSVKFNLVQFTDSSLTFSLGFNLEIFEFLTLTFKSESENTAIYKYIPAFTSVVGVSELNVIEDLIKSFNFFDINDRYESNFNLKTISIGLTHDLHDWDLNVKYSGSPYIDKTVGIPEYKWANILSIYLQWKAVTDIKSDIKIDKGEISF
jgi:hypothetical protein